MRVALRRIGNSLGVILPKATLDVWGVDEGDELELNERGLRPVARGGLPHWKLDKLGRNIALAIVDRFTPSQIRAQILANLHRWRKNDVWVSAFDEWQHIVEREDDGELFAAMLSLDEEAVRLRQSAPYVGLLSQEQVSRLNEEAAS